MFHGVKDPYFVGGLLFRQWRTLTSCMAANAQFDTHLCLFYVFETFQMEIKFIYCVFVMLLCTMMAAAAIAGESGAGDKQTFMIKLNFYVQ